MPKKQVTSAKTDDSILVSAAKAIGHAAGKVARLAGATPEAPAQAKSQKIGKLIKKNKHRLPRGEKKTLQKNSRKA